MNNLIDQLKELEGKATRGPWVASSWHNYDSDSIIAVVGERYRYIRSSNLMPISHREANAQLIVTLRNALPAIIERLESEK